MSDSDAWAKACAEDLEAEKARRRAQRGAETGSAADEFRKLFEAVAEKVSGGLGNPLLAGQAAQTVQQLVNQAKSVVEPVIERNPQVFDHLAAAGNELLAAYRSAVEAHESRWTRDEKVSPDDPSDPRRDTEGPVGQSDGDGTEDPRKGDEGPGTGQHIDLD
ncbi:MULTISPECIES: DUF5304 domain-containing protein [Streptomyces]|uniref:DUF5304 domain-containing protein n=1 Tax=Streptomyces venezuelae (strain ATCC 10712 / CBS 650.69 / DSM 40230 / JCM 4526 / NBRC 13096 / PD 04745) TaxID=953739 RepID=F2RI91_STRVP|nr:DUF5304 domain-containing protein [Streptomyces venezuelae]APE21101.1 hypothetical protein vnz_08760 [Streptomyces venezuelae]QER98494.1 hypothetical protein DEJ43_08845 [Streptomyces venezuelae ATCC 10712]CCA55074.1 hypothetical protein SVEN_1787 [Streptomyces venezuelae ATCC 10712]